VKVLLTGANGFVGSHLLDALIERDIPTAILLRPTARLGLIQSHLPRAEVRWGSVTDGDSLARSLEGITHVIHCAGLTKTVVPARFHEVNHGGTRLLVEAVNARQPAVERLVLISSLAAGRPGTASGPASETDPSAPVTEYGRSKLEGERVVREQARVPYVILRPAAVYGPRDRDFLHLFRAVRSRFAPRFGGGRQELSLVYAEDLGRATVAALEWRAARLPGTIWNVAAPGVVTAGQLGAEIARRLGVRPWTPSLPVACLWPVCAVCTMWSRLTGRPY
jgi:2-alkyl-3-oxoalkanoate reductase